MYAQNAALNVVPMQESAAVQVERVSREYVQGGASIHALREVSLKIHPGEFTALVGPSGSGKTTLLNMIGALDLPTSGTVSLGGENLATLSKAALAQLRLRKIGFVFQDYSLLPVLTAAENVEFVLQLQGVNRKERRVRAMSALAELGLADCGNRLPAQLSGGQQQRVTIARAIVGEPLLILADEPTANLDSITGTALLDTMQEINHRRGTTFVFSTHDSMVMQHARRIVRLHDGRLVEDSGA